MHTVEVRGEVRKASGKGGARQARAHGRTPGILYGAGEEPISISIDTRSFEKMLRQQGSAAFIVDLRLDGHEDRELKTLIKELQRDPITSAVLHVDLQHISMTQKIVVHVPVHLNGTPLGVKEGGILEQLLHKVEIQCLATQILERFEVDVSHLTKGHSVHVSDLPAQEGVTILTPAERVVATVVVKAVEAAPEAPAAAAAPAAAGAEEKGEETPAK